MYYAQMRKFDVANGIGIRSTLFVSGCSRGCPGCFNKAYKDFNYGEPWSKAAEDKFMDYIKDPNVHGVSILGGEPLEQTRDHDLLNLLKRIKRETQHTIWVYSGDTFEGIIQDTKKKELLGLCDVLVDGPFIENLKDLNLKFRGSSNQRIIDVQASLKLGHVILLDF